MEKQNMNDKEFIEPGNAFGSDNMKKCPKCGKSFERLLALSRVDNKTMICDKCGTVEALDSLPHGILTPQERTRIAVAATGNRWAMENFNATHN